MISKWLPLLLMTMILTTNLHAEVGGVKVVTTFQYLADDVKNLLCEGDEVYSLVPPGVDPHDYMLTPKDVELLKHADIIISTAHTHFEARISELIREGEVRAKLIEIPKIQGIELRYIAGTNIINYHAITYDINNYLILMRTISEELTTLRPECRSVYSERLRNISNTVEGLKNFTTHINLVAVGSTPLTQYVVEGLGIKVIKYLVVDHEVPPTPNDVSQVEKLLSTKSVDLVVITSEGSAADDVLRDLALKYSIPILNIPSPISPGDTLTKVESVIKQLSNISKEGYQVIDYYQQYILVISIIVLVMILAIVLRGVSRWR
ncbi:MAG: zinc ABC transporter substrate-binding protein [Sulfolobales archaeon]